MSYDNWDQEYHLTANGWVVGSSKYYGRTDSDVPRPANALETWNRHCTQASGWSREIYSDTLEWYDPSVSEEDRKTLRAKFGTNPWRGN